MDDRGSGRTSTRTAKRVSEKRVARLMREEGLRARARKRFRSTTMSEHDQPIAANVLARQFAAPGPNQRWVGDTTEFIIGGSEALPRPRFSTSTRASSSAGPSARSMTDTSRCARSTWR